MTEEVKTVENTENIENTEVNQYSDIEQRALEMGWRPKEDYNGAEEDFIDAKEFVNRKPLFDKIESQSKQIKAVSKALDALKQHYTKVQETEFNRALAQLKSVRKTALNEGDGDSFEEADNAIKQVEAQVQALQATAQTPAVQTEELHPEFQAWISKNPWYNSTRYMREFADDIGMQFSKNGLTPSEVLVEVEKAVRKEFPHKFTNPNKSNAPDVGSSRKESGSNRSRSDDNVELTDQERRIMNTLVSQGVLTKEKYIADLKAVKGKG